MNLLMQALIKKYPQILQISKLTRDTQRGNTFKSTNLSLKDNHYIYLVQMA